MLRPSSLNNKKTILISCDLMGLMPIFTNNPATPLKSSKMVNIDPSKNNLVSRPAIAEFSGLEGN